ncbi:hypothetical protein [Lentilactobacillus kosonis]|uniref:YtxH domain-containing protein n=1 Tax=Lentilactobacillus kosonis TaxID=2810561 RepID=A0A401FK97_9LACO|nr:hypothetical protein [Lentilactobacillus kosonis]GAY72815.1 hypothetical protein NBRC111893_961 [Lentilactobacillus kosonis]
MKTWLKVVGGSALLAGIYLYSREETPQEFIVNAKEKFTQKKTDVANFKTAVDNFKDSLNNFTEKSAIINNVMNDLQRNIDEAMFQIEPRLEEIQKHSDNLNDLN